MAEYVRIENLQQVINALIQEGREAKAASVKGAQAVATALQSDTMRNLNSVQNNTNGGHIGSNGDFPNRRTGRLSNSITVQARQGFGNYVFEVGPTMTYGRILELGFSNGARYPFMKPTTENLRPRVDIIFLNAVRRFWRG